MRRNKIIAGMLLQVVMTITAPVWASYTKADGQVCYSEEELKDCDHYKATGNVHHENGTKDICADKWEFRDRVGVGVLPGQWVDQYTTSSFQIVPRVSVTPYNEAVDLDFVVPFIVASGLDSANLCPYDFCERPFKLSTGQTFTIAPGLEWTVGRTNRLHPSFGIGIGGAYEQGATITDGLRTRHTRSSTSPVLTYGTAVNYRITPTVAIRLEARGVTIFREAADATEGELPGEFQPNLPGGRQTAAFLGFGVEFVLRR